MGQNSQNIPCHCEPVTDVTGVAIRSPKPSPVGKVARTTPASARRMRALPLPMGEVPRMGRRGRIYPLSHFVTAPPKWEPRGERIVTGGNPWKGPRQCEHWLAMTFFFGSFPEHPKSRNMEKAIGALHSQCPNQIFLEISYSSGFSSAVSSVARFCASA